MAHGLPSIKDPNLKVETFGKGLKSPVSMAFLGLDDVLVTEKEDGRVIRIVNGSVVLPPPARSTRFKWRRARTTRNSYQKARTTHVRLFILYTLLVVMVTLMTMLVELFRKVTLYIVMN